MNPTAKELKTAIAWHSGFGYTYTPIFIQLDGLIYNLDLDQYSLKWTWAHLRLCLQDMRNSSGKCLTIAMILQPLLQRHFCKF
ncbi:uncharacterized protein LOC111450724 isoform X2 [Cucurbita moschata]|uniref:Uncharacterized protein LOC111450724 isoform X2 n=1 Tax=Cucurbita moschata TaxID=3662 RepID=A0A6J1G4U9_CUCMO|nr:uncharacterized protein LOC111450724 isoform X2 [Cucurbita moschata]